MAIGDAADAAGMVVLAGTEDLRDTYIEHNRTRDYLANHQTSGTHSASAITSGVLDAARIPSIPLNTPASGATVLSLAINTTGRGFDPTGNVYAAALNASDAYDRSVAGHGGFRTLNVAADGVIGGVTSSRRYKEDIESADIPRHILRGLRVVFYRYIANTDLDEPLQLGLIAEEVHDLGLTWLVYYDDQGRPEGLAERALPALALLLAQDAEDRLDALTRTVDDLQAEVLELRGERS